VRIFEIASAEEQIELWKLVSNSVWQSLQQQQHEEQKRRAEAAAKKRVMPKGGKASARVGKAPIAMPPPMPISNQPPPAKQTGPQTTDSSIPQSSVNEPLASGALSAASAQPNAKKLPASALPNPLKTVGNAESQRLYVKKKSDEETDDRHSKNTLPLSAVRTPKRR
jgi:hypothetical protein